jgi:hypothetical protein
VSVKALTQFATTALFAKRKSATPAGKSVTSADYWYIDDRVAKRFYRALVRPSSLVN